MQRVLVLDKDKSPLMPCTPARARILLSQNKAQNNTQPIQVKIDQGSKTTGIAFNIKAIGRGSRQMCRVEGFGFPRTKAKKKGNCFGFKTGDIVKALVTKVKKSGTYVGRLTVRETGYFNIVTKDGLIQGINQRYCRLLQKNDGYNYSNHTNILTKKGEGQDNSSPT
jgi:hypothetical protein